MPGADKLITPEELARNERIRTRIVVAWSVKQIPARNALVTSGVIETDDIVECMAGRAFDKLSFEEAVFRALSPLTFMTPSANSYYVGGYMLNALKDASRAGENEWLGMDSPIIVMINALTEHYDQLEPYFSQEQKQCIGEFLQFVRDHAAFFFHEDKVGEIELAIQKARNQSM